MNPMILACLALSAATAIIVTMVIRGRRARRRLDRLAER
jgi:hypothetical protein